jgi:ABC-type sugar transport system ATPase subunit
MSVSDRIIVLCDGEISGRIDAADADERTLGLMMANALDPDPAPIDSAPLDPLQAKDDHRAPAKQVASQAPNQESKV